jgi:two-component system nitrogen regulation sensor histidine kinase NtrY
MFNKLKNFKSVILLSTVCIALCILTFLAFINPKLLSFLNIKLQFLLTIDIFLLVVILFIIIKKSSSLYLFTKNKKVGSQTSLRYISLFTLFTFIPSFLIAVFSLFIFNYGLQNFFNSKIKKAVNSSYDVAKSYSEQNKQTVESDVFLMSVGLNRASALFYSNPERFKNIARSEKLLRRVDDIFLIDSSANIIFYDADNIENFIKPSEEEINKALEVGVPVLITNNLESKTSAMIKLNSLIDTYLFISRNVDPKIIKYLNETEQAVNFFYSIESKQLGIKITFAIIYILVVGLLLFISTFIAIAFADRLTKPIINLIKASDNISKGILDSKVPESETYEEFLMLNKNFNNMIDRLKKQQNKLLIAERYTAWESVARKLAHEIKNPLTPIQLSIDRLQEKFYKKIDEGQDEFKNYLSTINRQIKDIENLVNEFSSFARMPSPMFKKIQVSIVIKRAVDFYKMSSKSEIHFKSKAKKDNINGDEEQLYRVFINLIKNSEDSIAEKKEKNKLFKGKIDIEINDNNDYITVALVDNGVGIKDTSKIMTPYFTTKKKGTGLGLPIVSKIINEHKSELTILNNNPGVKALIVFPKI